MAVDHSKTPMEDAIRGKLQISEALHPMALEITNDSHLHAHHRAMQGNTSRETHFRVMVAADAFEGKSKPTRHRIVYRLLADEMSQPNGIHALQLQTLTPSEREKALQPQNVVA